MAAVSILPHHVEVGLCVVSADVLHEAGKTFVQPESVPPRHGHQVAKPLRGGRGEGGEGEGGGGRGSGYQDGPTACIKAVHACTCTCVCHCGYVAAVSRNWTTVRLQIHVYIYISH